MSGPCSKLHCQCPYVRGPAAPASPAPEGVSVRRDVPERDLPLLLLQREAALDDALGGQLRHRGPHPDHVDAGDGVPVQVVCQDQGAQDQQPGLVRRQPQSSRTTWRWRRQSSWRGTWTRQVCTGFVPGLTKLGQVWSVRITQTGQFWFAPNLIQVHAMFSWFVPSLC